MNDSKGRRDGPGINKFAAATGGGVGEDTVWATSDPFFDVVPHFVPIEAEADTVECFEGHKMTTSGAGMTSTEKDETHAPTYFGTISTRYSRMKMRCNDVTARLLAAGISAA